MSKIGAWFMELEEQGRICELCKTIIAAGNVLCDECRAWHNEQAKKCEESKRQGVQS